MGCICQRRERGGFQLLCKCGKGSGDARWTQVLLFLHLFTFKKVLRRDITCGILSLLSFCMSAIVVSCEHGDSRLTQAAVHLIDIYADNDHSELFYFPSCAVLVGRRGNCG